MEHTDQNQTPQTLPTIDNPAIYPVRLVASKASKNDDVPLIVQALSLAAKPESRNTVQDVLRSGLRNSLGRHALKVLSYLLDNGADVSMVDPGWLYSEEDPFAKPSLEALEMLIAHGWDIDARPSRISWPLLWHVVEYPDLVEWCLDHGASVYLPGDTPPRDANGIGQVPRISLLERAASEASVPTFKLLREKGAPFHRGVLHAAVERAVQYAPPFNGSISPSTGNIWFNERMAMIRYLVDEVAIDVNSEWWRPGKAGATPLDFVAYHSSSNKDVRELVWFLLDRGADLNHASVLKYGYKDQYIGTGISYLSPLEVAQQSSDKRFLEAIQEWQEQQRNNST